MSHDSEYFRKRAAEARASAFCKEFGEDVEAAGGLALAYAALARRREAVVEDEPVAESSPILLQDSLKSNAGA